MIESVSRGRILRCVKRKKIHEFERRMDEFERSNKIK